MDKSPVVVQITKGTIISFLLLVFLAWIVYKMSFLVMVVIAAIIFSLALAPGKRRLVRLGFPEPVAVLMIFSFFFIILTLFLYSLVPLLLEQYQGFLDIIPELVDKFQSRFTGTIFEDVALTLTPNTDDLLGLLVKAAVPNIFSLFGGILNLILFFMLTFLFSVNSGAITSFFQVIVPGKYRAYTEGLWQRTQVKVGHWFHSQIILALVLFSMTYLALLIIGVPNALFLAAFAGLMEMLPFLGPVLGAIPAVLMVVATSGDMTTVLIVIIVFTIIQQIESNLIYPLVVSKVVGISPILIIISVVVGGSLAGILGVIIAVPMASIFQDFFNDVKDGKLKECEEQAVS